MSRLTSSASGDELTHRRIPAGASGAASRGDLFAALSFIDDPPRTARALAAWLEIHHRRWGWSQLPATVQEPAAGVIPLPPPDAPEAAMEIAPLVLAARHRVLRALLAYVGPARDAAFVALALSSSRVRRPALNGPWCACPSPTDALSDLVLGLFAADVLNHRAFHEQQLCVCRVCHEVSFYPRATGRTGCQEHPGPSIHRPSDATRPPSSRVR